MEKSRPLNQDNWKRTQVRLPPELHDAIIKYAENNKLSLTSAILELIEKGINDQETTIVMSESDSGMFSVMFEGLKEIAQKQTEMAENIERLKELYPEDKDKLGMLEEALKPRK
ncbi:hypothetical protein [Acinetobacter bereziniae]|uniref:hypothetical protein n=1 Tax=Acinetobacter bereziniae TaxID=106648 RepID=UPI0019006548|nr:hypothetical protein [Acinetobacter bereziniae]MBJ8476473.1 hypothetical protein [Acinetobacter bereziniae]